MRPLTQEPVWMPAWSVTLFTGQFDILTDFDVLASAVASVVMLYACRLLEESSPAPSKIKRETITKYMQSYKQTIKFLVWLCDYSRQQQQGKWTRAIWRYTVATFICYPLRKILEVWRSVPWLAAKLDLRHWIYRNSPNSQRTFIRSNQILNLEKHLHWSKARASGQCNKLHDKCNR